MIAPLRIPVIVAIAALPLYAQDRLVGEFPAELGRNFAGLFDHSNLLPLAAGAGAALGATGADDPVRAYFGPVRRMKELGDVGDVLGGPAVVTSAVGALFVAGRFTGGERFRSMTYSLAQATSLNVGLTLAAKAVVRRERPNGENNRSFYSGHSATAFTVAAVAGDYYGTRAGIISYSLATLVSASRIEKDKHFLTDTLAGAAAGFIVGRTVTRRDKKSGRIPAIAAGPGPQGGVQFSVWLGSR